MTNQEAREELADLADSLNLIPSTRKGQAMQMALDALKEQHTKEEILNYFSDLNVVYNNPNKLDDLRKMLDKLTEQKTGRWEYLQYDANPRVGNWHCSACHNILIQYGTKELPPLYTHCPSCGAKMEVEE